VGALLRSLAQDLRHGARMFARNPGLTAIAVVSIAFGTGANVAMFSVTDAMLLRPLPVLHPDALLAVGSRVRRGPVYNTRASYLDYLDIRDRTRTFEGLLAYDYSTVGVTVRAGDLPRVVMASFVSDNYFSVLGRELAMGRPFHPDEAKAGTARPVAILSHGMWRNDYLGNPEVIGRTLRVAGRDFTIVGVAPETFTGLHALLRESLFLPLGMLGEAGNRIWLDRPDVLAARDARNLTLKGRLRAGATLAEAQAELSAIGRDLERAYPTTNANVALIAQTELDFKFEQRPLDAAMILVLTTLSVAVLCVACANVAGLLASRGPVRAREMAVRLAIGADRARLIRQLLTESFAVAAAGAVGGLLVGQIGIRLLRQIQLPTDLIKPPLFELDDRALLVSLAVAAASALIVGLGPALQTTQVDLTSSLKSGDRGGSRERVTGRAVLVSVQVALSLVMLTIAVFAVQIAARELGAGPGFRTAQIAKITVDPGQARYDEARAARFFARVLEETRALPGVRSASITSAMPMHSFQFAPIVPEGSQLPPDQSSVPAWVNSVDDRYFETMDIDVVAGRGFTSEDDEAAPPVAIVNTTLARHYWRDVNPVGARVQVLDAPRPSVEIVGVVETTKLAFPGELPQEAIYFPYRQRPRGQMVVLAHTAGASAELLEPMRDVVLRLDRDVPIFDVQTMEEFYYVSATSLLGTIVEMIGGIGVMGLALTMVGLYGLVSYGVSRRTREIGIRIAVGATYARIVRMILHEGMRPAWLGLAAGLLLSAITDRLLLRLVPVEQHVGRETYYIVLPLVAVVTLTAAFVPARRAAKVSPTVALRCE
jgi:putative ABC transport system permease protein